MVCGMFIHGLIITAKTMISFNPTKICTELELIGQMNEELEVYSGERGGGGGEGR